MIMIHDQMIYILYRTLSFVNWIIGTEYFLRNTRNTICIKYNVQLYKTIIINFIIYIYRHSTPSYTMCTCKRFPILPMQQRHLFQLTANLQLSFQKRNLRWTWYLQRRLLAFSTVALVHSRVRIYLYCQRMLFLKMV